MSEGKYSVADPKLQSLVNFNTVRPANKSERVRDIKVRGAVVLFSGSDI